MRRRHVLLFRGNFELAINNFEDRTGGGHIMNEYLVHYMDKDEKRVRTFYFLDYKDLNMLMRDLTAMEFEATYGEVLDMEKVVIDEYENTSAVSA